MNTTTSTHTPPSAMPVPVADRLNEMENASILRLAAAAGRNAKLDKRDVHILQASSNPAAPKLLSDLQAFIADYKAVAPVPAPPPAA